jgi:hypothetical protein
MDDKAGVKTPNQGPVKAKSFTESQGRFARDHAAASAAGKVGGVKAAETRRRRGALREAARALLAVSPDRLPGVEDLADVLRLAGIEGATMADAVALAQVLKAAKGDTEAARFIRDTSGERPADQLQVIPGEVIDAESVAGLSDEELAELASATAPAVLPGPGADREGGADVAPAVAPGAELEPEAL